MTNARVTGVSSAQDADATPWPATAQRHIWLCADDYGISPAVGSAIRDLITRGRLNATSVMVTTPSFNRAEALSLATVETNGRPPSIGLHVTLTAPFGPANPSYPVKRGTFPSIGGMMRLGFLRALDVDALTTEVATQIKIFTDAFDRPPDFVDGHQHVHLLPQVSEAVLAAIRQHAPAAWVRQCGRTGDLLRRLNDRKGLVLDVLSRRFRRLAAAHGLATNPGFAGTYDFNGEQRFADLFPRFLDGLPDGGVVMCHPGLVDAELTRLDSLTMRREQEFAYLASDAFPALLRAKAVVLA
jgi:predicted glycoside hydrolase/deacetylase ChbG (UPF0249 family)